MEQTSPQTPQLSKIELQDQTVTKSKKNRFGLVLLILLFIVAIATLVLGIYMLLYPKTDLNIQNGSNRQKELNTFQLPKPQIIKKTYYFETNQGDIELGKSYYNKDIKLENMQNTLNKRFIPQDSGLIWTTFTEEVQEDNNTVYKHGLEFYDPQKKQMITPNLPTEYKAGFGRLNVTALDVNTVILSVAKISTQNDTPESNPLKTYLWDTKNNTTKEINLNIDCKDLPNPIVCDGINNAYKIDNETILLSYSFGDACFSATTLAKYDVLKNTTTILQSISNQNPKHTRFFGVHDKKLVLGNIETLPRKSEEEFCPSTKLTGLYQTDIDLKKVKDYDVSKLQNTLNPYLEPLNAYQINKVYFSKNYDPYSIQQEQRSSINLSDNSINNNEQAFDMYVEKIPTEAKFKEEILQSFKPDQLMTQNINDETFIATLVNNFNVVLYKQTDILKFIPESVKNYQQQLQKCGVNYEVEMMVLSDSSTDNKLNLSFKIDPSIRQTNSKMSEKIQLKACVANVPDINITYRLDTINHALSLLDVTEQNPLLKDKNNDGDVLIEEDQIDTF